MRLALLLPLTVLLSCCCDCDCGWSLWIDDTEVEQEQPTHVRVNNKTDQPIIVRYTSAGGVDYRTNIPIGGYLEFDAGSHSQAIKADYNHIIHWYDVGYDCDETVDMNADDFVPATPSAND